MATRQARISFRHSQPFTVPFSLSAEVALFPPTAFQTALCHVRRRRCAGLSFTSYFARHVYLLLIATHPHSRHTHTLTHSDPLRCKENQGQRGQYPFVTPRRGDKRLFDRRLGFDFNRTENALQESRSLDVPNLGCK